MTGLQCANQTRPVPSDGIARSGVRYDPASYRAGYVAGLTGRPNIAPREIPDSLAWHSGFIEGKATRTSGALRFRRYKGLKSGVAGAEYSLNTPHDGKAKEIHHDQRRESNLDRIEQ
jgi:hypothetical protein